MKELSLRCKEDERVVRVLDKNKQIFPAGVFHLVTPPVKFSSIKNINVVDCQNERRIEFPDDFDGNIKTDVSLRLRQIRSQ